MGTRMARLATITVLVAMLVCVLAMPAAAATVTVVQGRVLGCGSGDDVVSIGAGAGQSQQYVSGTYRDSRTGRVIYYWYRFTIPGFRITPKPAPEPAPEPEPEPEPEPAPEPEPEPEPEPPTDSLTAEERQMFDLVNKERRAVGLSPLELDMRLVEQARLKSQDMSRLGYFAHQSPTYGSPFDQMKKAGISYRAAGENLAGAPTVEMAHDGLMNSPGHRANILNATYTHVGIGVATSSRYGLLFTQMFIAK
ncbi:MAG: CAP domain-containing protein [Ignavibacteriales bacterium]